MGDNSFYIYDGQVRKIPSDVHDYVFDNINYPYRATSCGGHNRYLQKYVVFSLVESQKVPNKYVIWNYVDNVWSIGNLDRICLVRSGVLDYPVACSSDGIVYEHESGLLSSSLDLGNENLLLRVAL